MKTYDVIVIGSGQAGTPLARKMAKAGKKTVIIEKRLVGGTCVNDGCTPTKAMVASAKAVYNAMHSAELGVPVSGFRVDMKAIKQRRDQIVEHSRKGNQDSLQHIDNLELVFGEASFTGPKTIRVKLNSGGVEDMRADQVFIDTGASPVIPEIEGLDQVEYLTSTTILDLEIVPEHLLIIGGNYIALEFGQMFRRFGSKVTIVERGPRIMSREDEDISAELQKILEAEEIRILSNAQTQQLERAAGGSISAMIEMNGVPQQISCTHLLIATGRKPQTQALNLQSTGVELDDKRYIKVNDKLETNISGIYALGDVKGGPAFTHISFNDYTIVYRNLMEGTNYTITNRPIPYCMFTDPQLGRIGLTETEARKQGLNIKVAKLPMAHVARAAEVGDTRGVMKAVVNADTKKILGAAILGQEGGEIMSVLQMAIEGGITYDRIRYCVFAHPTYSESLNNLFMQIEE